MYFYCTVLTDLAITFSFKQHICWHFRCKSLFAYTFCLVANEKQKNYLELLTVFEQCLEAKHCLDSAQNLPSLSVQSVVTLINYSSNEI